MEAFHPNDGEEVVCEEEDEHGGDQARTEDDSSAEHVTKSPLHAKERQQPSNKYHKLTYESFDES